LWTLLLALCVAWLPHARSQVLSLPQLSCGPHARKRSPFWSIRLNDARSPCSYYCSVWLESGLTFFLTFIHVDLKVEEQWFGRTMPMACFLFGCISSIRDFLWMTFFRRTAGPCCEAPWLHWLRILCFRHRIAHTQLHVQRTCHMHWHFAVGRYEHPRAEPWRLCGHEWYHWRVSNQHNSISSVACCSCPLPWHWWLALPTPLTLMIGPAHSLDIDDWPCRTSMSHFPNSHAECAGFGAGIWTSTVPQLVKEF
jgi:hypothetical protein